MKLFLSSPYFAKENFDVFFEILIITSLIRFLPNSDSENMYFSPEIILAVENDRFGAHSDFNFKKYIEYMDILYKENCFEF